MTTDKLPQLSMAVRDHNFIVYMPINVQLHGVCVEKVHHYVLNSGYVKVLMEEFMENNFVVLKV